MEQMYKHFFNRAGFGVYPGTKANMNKTLPTLLKESSGTRNIEVLKLEEAVRSGMKGDEKKERRAKIRDNSILLNTTWMNQMDEPSLVVREKMTLFWHDHFACRTRNPYLAQQQNNTIREHALGKFTNLLMAVSKDPAMLQFLNNQQNKKDNPNENFAREVMELFTLGHGEYTEADIKHAARAFTGWGFNPLRGDFVFRKNVHDATVKTFRGRTGNFSGEDIISMILEDSATSRFITLKVWRWLVNPKLTDPDIIKEYSDDFYSSGYDISRLVERILASAAQNDHGLTRRRIKSPVELITGIKVHTEGKFATPLNLLFLQKLMGHVLFHPPNVGGWPVDEEWIDSASLALRISLPMALLEHSETEFRSKDDGDVNNVTNALEKARKISFSVDWQKLTNIFTKGTAGQTVEAIEDHLLSKPSSADNRKIVQGYAAKSSEDPEFIKKAFIGIMSLPDYQLI